MRAHPRNRRVISALRAELPAGSWAYAPGLMAVLRHVWRHAAVSDVNGLAAELALRSFLAFIPFCVVVATISGVVDAWTASRIPLNERSICSARTFRRKSRVRYAPN